MTTLAIISRVTPLVLDALIREHYNTSGDMIVRTLTPQAHQALKGTGISPMLIEARPTQPVAERDTAFANVAMWDAPGLNWNIPGTKLKAWKPMALDRYRFFYEGQHSDILEKLLAYNRFDRLLVTLDFHATVIWWVAEHTPVPAVAVQCGSIRTREFVDLAPVHFPFSAFLTREQDADFARKYVSVPVVGSVAEVYSAPETVSEDERKKARAAAGLPLEGAIHMVVFESQTEYMARAFFYNKWNGSDPLVIYPVNEKAKYHLFELCEDVARRKSVIVADDFDTAQRIANACVLFRYMEGIVLRLRIPYLLADKGNRFRSKEMVA